MGAWGAFLIAALAASSVAAAAVPAAGARAATLHRDGTITFGWGPAGDDLVVCEGLSPLQPDCTTGPHAGTPCCTTIHFPACADLAGSCWVGDVQSVLSGPNAEIRFACSSIDVGGVSPWLTCAAEGEFPIGTFTHDCHARAPLTVDNGLAGSGLPAGAGAYGCSAVFS